LGSLVTKEVAERLRAVFPDARIVVFLRSQPALVGAAYAQYVRAGGTHDLPTYLGWAKRKGASKYWYKAPAFSFDHLEYQPLLDHYAECFGRAAISVHLFEDFAADARAFIQAFAAEHDLEVDIDALAYSPVNRSLSPRQLRILARLNLLTARSVPNKRWISDRPDWYARRWTWLQRAERWLGWAYSDEPLLAPAARDRIASLFAASNAELERSWGLALAANGYPLPSLGDGTAGPERPRATNGRNFPL
jgi:hypothetical protein